MASLRKQIKECSEKNAILLGRLYGFDSAFDMYKNKPEEFIVRMLHSMWNQAENSGSFARQVKVLELFVAMLNKQELFEDSDKQSSKHDGDAKQADD